MIRRNHVKNCIWRTCLSEKSLKLEVKWHLNIQAADKMIPVSPLASHFHLITEHKYLHSMMKNFFRRKMSCHLLMQFCCLFAACIWKTFSWERIERKTCFLQSYSNVRLMERWSLDCVPRKEEQWYRKDIILGRKDWLTGPLRLELFLPVQEEIFIASKQVYGKFACWKLPMKCFCYCGLSCSIEFLLTKTLRATSSYLQKLTGW